MGRWVRGWVVGCASELVSGWGWVGWWVGEWVSERVGGGVNQWVSKWVSENKWVSERAIVSASVREWVREWVSARVSEWVNTRVSARVREWAEWLRSWHTSCGVVCPKCLMFHSSGLCTSLATSCVFWYWRSFLERNVNHARTSPWKTDSTPKRLPSRIMSRAVFNDCFPRDSKARHLNHLLKSADVI